MTALLQVTGLSFAYGKEPLLRNISLELMPGKIYVLAGRNGSGKSTLLRLLTGILPLQQGQILWNGTPLPRLTPGRLARHVAVVWTGRPAPGLSVKEILRTAVPGPPDAALWDLVVSGFDLGGLLSRPATRLSDGEFQRLMIGRAVLQNTPVILLDEPATHLDPVHKARIFGLLARWARKGKTILFTTHDIQLIEGLEAQLFLLHQGKLIQPARHEQNRWLQEVFSHEMLTFDPDCGTFKFKG